MATTPSAGARPSDGSKRSRIRTAGSAEQDAAAGGTERRRVRVSDDETAMGSIEIKEPHQGGACWAYLRFSLGGKTVNRYVGRVTGVTRADQLQQAWRLVRRKGLLDQRLHLS